MTEHAPGPSEDENPLRLRSIRSFVLRQGRVTDAQKRAFVDYWPRYGLEIGGHIRDFDQLFGRQAERVLEIGFGNGEQVLYAVEHEPARDIIAIEVHGPGVGRCLHGLAALNASNVRVYQHDAVEVLQQDIADVSLDEVRIYFPDPWHKKRHHKRRLVNPEFVALLCNKLKPGGKLHLATDWENYAEHMWDVLDAESRLVNDAGVRGSVPRPAWRRQTHFETRGLKLGHGVWDLLYTRR